MSTSSAFPVFKVPFETLTKFDSLLEPTAEAVRLLRRELYANASAIPTQLGGGLNGHLGLIMPDAEYLELAGEAYYLPDPPDIPDYQAAEAPEERSEWDKLFLIDTQQYQDAHGMSQQLLSQIVAAVPQTFLDELYDDTHGFGRTSVKEMLALLMDNYGDIDSESLADNLKKATAPWDPSTRINDVFTNGNACRRFAIEGGEPIPDSAYIRMLLQVFRESGVFGRAIEDWEAKPKATRTVANLQKHFTEANKLRRRREESLKGTLTANTTVANSANIGQFRGFDYCWSHGVCDHSGTKCPKPAEGHVKTATLNNLAGGCTWVQRPQGFQPVFKLPPRNPNNGGRPRGPRGKGKGKDGATPTPAPSANA
jgi:hypothetical protein